MWPALAILATATTQLKQLYLAPIPIMYQCFFLTTIALSFLTKLTPTPSTCIPYAVHIIKKPVRNFLLPEFHITAAKFLGTKITFMNFQGTLLWCWWLKHKWKLNDHHHGPMGYATVSMASFLCLVHESVGNVSVSNHIHSRHTGNLLFIYHHHHHHHWTMVMLCSILLPQLFITIKNVFLNIQFIYIWWNHRIMTTVTILNTDTYQKT